MRDLLNKPDVCNSLVNKCLNKLFKDQWLTWEPYTIFKSLKDEGVLVTDSLQGKILAAQTILVSDTWTYDHDVLFNFALTEDGVPASSDLVVFPTPEQLCWAVDEIEELLNKKITNDEGFDNDTVDPAVVSVLLYEGYAYKPDKLLFCLDVFEKTINEEHVPLMKDVEKAWKLLKNKTIDELKNVIKNSDDSDPLTVQISRLADCKIFTNEKQMLRSEYARSYL